MTTFEVLAKIQEHQDAMYAIGDGITRLRETINILSIDPGMKRTQQRLRESIEMGLARKRQHAFEIQCLVEQHLFG